MTPQKGDSVLRFACDRCGRPIVPIDMGRMVYDPDMALESASRVYICCIECVPAVEAVFTDAYVKHLDEFFKLIVT